MIEVTTKIEGTGATLMHADTLCDPLHPLSREMASYSKKRIKTEDDYKKIAWLDWRGGLYYDPDVGPHWPSQNLQRMLRDAAALRRKGKDVVRAVLFDKDIFKLDYPGPRTPEEMFESRDPVFKLSKPVVISRARVLRTRPMFHNWSLQFSFLIDESVVEPGDAEQYLHDAGKFISLSDWRPRYGRFEVSEFTYTKIG